MCLEWIKVVAPTHHLASRVWEALNPDAESPESVEVLQEGHPLRPVYRLVDGSGRAVIAKCLVGASGATERNVYEHILPRVGIRQPAFLGGTRAEPDGSQWIFVTEASGRAYNEGDQKDRIALATWLGTLHTGITWEPPNLPDKSPKHYRSLLHNATRSLENRIAQQQTSTRESRAIGALLAQCARLESRWSVLEDHCSAGPRTLVHGDLVAHNVFIRERSSTDEVVTNVVVIDWEKAGWGSPAEDLSGVDLDTYRQLVVDRWPRLEREWWRSLAEVGRFFRSVVFVAWVLSRPGDLDESAVSNLELATSWLDELSNRQGW